jgi:hypothetical protein
MRPQTHSAILAKALRDVGIENGGIENSGF